ncbi:RagB/SusD family nutrient uptake outer membrane protein [Mariniphaga sediminis]|uniref:RagB/SusD family nutrient uptake outer membrane protein n=1 Tax=Mariniphaga sediminis TaxID=1628158 RepID=A0A399CUN2_9BACT|nr:RagB/SusD family nutrient uptake outer membrane protein [Mariniphaga sediminis]RIH62996.1 RagB/SusD family nutrient uptake outer membrane protein [Mariniphaga sediminis]
MKYIKLLYIVPILSLLFWSCEKLDYSEASNYTQDYIFSDPHFTNAFLSNIYSYLPADFHSINDAMRSNATDDATFVNALAIVHKFNDGTWSSIQTLDCQWENMYAGIRACNLFLTEMEKNRNFEELRYNDDYELIMERYKLYPYEARFLRAFFYFELIKRYGDVPLITAVLSQEEANNVTRTPYSTIVDFIVEECDEVSAELPVTFLSVPGSETGRATKGAALALKARTLLYAASPLHNPSNNAEKWIEAAKTAKDIIDSDWYSLDDSYESTVNNLASKELIFERRQESTNSFERTNFPVGIEGGNTGTCPTQNLVDSYEMSTTGKGIFEPGSEYEPTNPYANRDPRLHKTVLYNGAVFKGKSIEIWDGGLNGSPKLNATKTGYYLKKYVMESVSLDPTNITTREHVWVIFRLSEILLNYAEAMNEAFGPMNTGTGSLLLSATDAVNMIRARAGMPDFPNGMSKDEFRDKLMNERRVELAFEDHRFWDIRRWKIGASTKDIYGVEVAKNETGTLSYSTKLVENRIWEDKMNLYPIPQTELFINQSLVQNKDW